jgi:hypothetical protein
LPPHSGREVEEAVAEHRTWAVFPGGQRSARTDLARSRRRLGNKTRGRQYRSMLGRSGRARPLAQGGRSRVSCATGTRPSAPKRDCRETGSARPPLSPAPLRGSRLRIRLVCRDLAAEIVS